ncbi:hypothetical protein ACSBR1_040382 [Camellia fascicularis]
MDLKQRGGPNAGKSHRTIVDGCICQLQLRCFSTLSLLFERGIATVGKLVNFEACMDIMDLLYEKDQTSALYNSPKYLAASILACCFIRYHSCKTEMGASCSSLGCL